MAAALDAVLMLHDNVSSPVGPAPGSFSVLGAAGSSVPGRAAAAAAGPDAGSADVQPGQLGTVLEELLDGDVAHVQLRRQRVLLLDGRRQLLEHLCGADRQGVSVWSQADRRNQ